MGEENGANSEDVSYEHFQPIPELVIQAPIVGYEVVEARKRFTVYQISVSLGDGRNWFVFRRYSDFSRLDENLRKIFNDDFPDCSLPQKRYIGDNFAHTFIIMRKNALQEYLDKILERNSIAASPPVVDFLCLDDPPGPYDSLEESRAFIENLEDTVSDLKHRQTDLFSELRLAKAQLGQAQSQRRALLVALRAERVLNGKPAYDDDDVALITEYSGHPEVGNLDLKKFGKDDGETAKARGRNSRFVTSTVASQWDLTIATSGGFGRQSRGNSLNSSIPRRARSTSDLSNSSYRRTTKHLPSNNRGTNLSLLDKFMRQSTEALQQIRLSVRQKLGRWEDESS